jgi:Niemann-Pick C1 protein
MKGKYRIFNIEFRGQSSIGALVASIFIDMKFTLGLVGVTIVMLSVLSSVGFLSFMGVKATLIIFEVIPFLVLAVGVDNIFILVQNYQRDVRPSKTETIERQIGRIVGKVGPSMLLTSTSESLAFVLGALTPMPAVRLFSLYAAMAVLIDFLLQITCFVSLMTLDAKRERGKRFDLLCCVKSSEASEEDQEVFDEPEEFDDADGGKQQRTRADKADSGFLFRLFKNYYADFLTSNITRPLVIVFFLAVFFTGCALVPKVSVGLDQKLSMPKDSYVLDYFKSLEKYLSVGVPVYFVIQNDTQVLDYSNVHVQNMICTTSNCDSDSMLNQINQAVLQSDYSKLAVAANSWLDDYFDWLLSPDCCRVYPNNTSQFCPSMSPDYDNCVRCNYTLQPGYNNRPVQADFYKYLKFYLVDNPGLKCAKGGHAAYGESLELIAQPDVPGGYRLGGTFFMGYHSVGLTSTDFIESLRHANEICQNVTTMMREKVRKYITNDTQAVEGIRVFPYR